MAKKQNKDLVSEDMRYLKPDNSITNKVKELLEKDTFADGKTILMMFAEELDKINDKIERLKRRIK